MRLAHRSSAAQAARQAPARSSSKAIALSATGWSRPRARGWPTGGVLRRLRARLAALQLDVRLVAGEDPFSDPALACRAAQLTRRRCRDQLAGGLERLLSPTRGRAAFSAAIPFDRRAVEIARPALEQLAIVLRSPEPIAPRGVALTRLLLTDPCGAVYAPAYADQLYDVAREALLAVDPDHSVAERYRPPPVPPGSRSRGARARRGKRHRP